ncbi:MAG: hypothetical protein A3F74_24805 [Betaproteobacteria bacterium RIFCSPLOWO2_12_FULL_62_58]|nr:MAG: hypothetical protein A3F74_24805 [Betaproteobacteria bacterium RIFCSPLOWO2_12_FULL_62_58]
MTPSVLQDTRKIKPLKLADQLYEEIMAAIINGRIPEGARLESETGLATAYGVSRPVVREALSRLRADGVIVSRRGSGSYVQRKPSQRFLTLAPLGGIADLMRCFEFRIALEGETAALAAARRTDKDLKEIRLALEDLEDAIRRKVVGVKADIRFHNAIAAASKNSLFTTTLKALANTIFQGISVARRLSLHASMERLQIVQEEHGRIYDAIRAGNSGKARDAMREHIENARARVLSDSTEPLRG